MRVAVTGGTGFIGRGLVRELVARGHQVLNMGRSANGSGSIQHLQTDLSDPDSYAEALATFAPEAACHLAWEGIPDFSRERCERNLSMSNRFIDMLMALGSCRKVIGAGSCWEYGMAKGACLESAPSSAVNDFTRAKDAIRRHGMSKAGQSGKSFGWFRIFFVYGPGQRKGSLIPSVIDACRRNENLPLKNPQAAQDFIYLDDVIDALARAIELDWPSGAYNLGTGSLTSVADIVRMVRELMSDQGTVIEPAARQDAGGIWASTEQTKLHLQWKSRTPLAEGLRKTLAGELRP
jgi:UDP-glucose 4-epimerase